MRHFQKLIWTFTLITLSGCNIFKGMDHPSSDAQYRSAAEACMDEGDIKCAEENLAKLSANEKDTQLSLNAYLGLMKVGVTPGTLMRTIYNSILKTSSISNLQNHSLFENPDPSNLLPIPSYVSGSAACRLSQEHNYGVLITSIAKLINTPTTEQRQTLFKETIQNAFQIKSPSLNAYVRFLSLVTFMGHLLAENQEVPHQLSHSDLVNNPTQCVATRKDTPPIGCDAPTGKPSANMKRGLNLGSFATATADTFSGPVTMFMLAKTSDELAQSISDLNSASYNVTHLSDSLSILSTLFGIENFNTGGFVQCIDKDADCLLFRAALIDSSIGDCQ